MNKLSLHKVVTLAAVLAMGSVSIAGEALATGGGVNCYDGEALALGGNCRANDEASSKQFKKQFNMTARSYRGAALSVSLVVGGPEPISPATMRAGRLGAHAAFIQRAC